MIAKTFLAPSVNKSQRCVRTPIVSHFTQAWEICIYQHELCCWNWDTLVLLRANKDPSASASAWVLGACCITCRERGSVQGEGSLIWPVLEKDRCWKRDQHYFPSSPALHQTIKSSFRTPQWISGVPLPRDSFTYRGRARIGSLASNRSQGSCKILQQGIQLPAANRWKPEFRSCTDLFIIVLLSCKSFQ